MEKVIKAINFFITFYISHKSGVKIFLIWFIKNFLKALVNMTIYNIYIIVDFGALTFKKKNCYISSLQKFYIYVSKCG